MPLHLREQLLWDAGKEEHPSNPTTPSARSHMPDYLVLGLRYLESSLRAKFPFPSISVRS